VKGSDIQIEVDRATAADWSEALDTFADANIYQTWAYGAVRWGEQNLSHLILRDGGKPIAMAQLVIAGPSRIGIGIGYLRWGPVCQRNGEELDETILARVATELHDEYVVRRRLFLRVLPNACLGTERGGAFEKAFASYSSEPFREGETFRTLELDLTPPSDVIRKKLDQKWRNQLNRAERNGLVVRAGTRGEDFATYIAMHREMLARKRFAVSSDIAEFARMQQHLSPNQRMIVLTCERDGIPAAGLVGSSMGASAIYLFGATTDQGMKSKGAYLLQWHMIQWLKQQGVARYDLGGINPDTNPGVYHFKAGLAGKDLLYVAPFTSCTSIGSKVFATAARRAGGSVRDAIRKFRRLA
jgi:lipid II:glycine glycyltransferase (peptidoglycan interpeptide bridge formation enzyme)